MRQVCALWCIWLLSLRQGGTLAATAADDSITSSFVGLYAASQLHQLTAFQAINNYTHHLPPVLRLNGIVNAGATARLRGVLDKLIKGEIARVGVIGGSTSLGYGVHSGKTDWFSVISKYLQTAFPSASVKARNGCTRAAHSEFVGVCLEKFVDKHVDLVFVELTTTDGYLDTSINNLYSHAFERLVRKLLHLPNQPAVVLMHSLYPGAHNLQLPFYHTIEDHYNVISQYYQLPSLSLRDAIWQGLAHSWEGFRAQDIFISMERVTQRHLSELGHKYLADMAVGLLQQTYLEVMLQPYSLPDMLEGTAIPPPLFPHNYEHQNMACATGLDLLGAVLNHTGWVFVNEGVGHRPKWGYVSHTPGSRLVLQLSTRASAQHPIPQPKLQQKLDVLTQHGMVAAAAALQQKATHAARVFNPASAEAAVGADVQGYSGVLQDGGVQAAMAESDRQAKLAADLLHSGQLYHHRSGGLTSGLGHRDKVVGVHGGRSYLPMEALQSLGATTTRTGVEVVTGRRLLDAAAAGMQETAGTDTAASSTSSMTLLSSSGNSSRGDVIPPPADAVYLRPGIKYGNPRRSSSSSIPVPIPVPASSASSGTGAVLPGALVTLSQQLPVISNLTSQADMLIWVGYVKSRRMTGRARIHCISGCACQESVIDAWHNQAGSQIRMAKVWTSQTSECLVGIEVLAATGSGRHKVKITGVMVSRAVDYDRASDLPEQLLMVEAEEAESAHLDRGEHG